jgi:hypothetical protein
MQIRSLAHSSRSLDSPALSYAAQWRCPRPCCIEPAAGRDHRLGHSGLPQPAGASGWAARPASLAVGAPARQLVCRMLGALPLRQSPRVCGVVHNQSTVKAQFHGSPSHSSVSGPKARAALPPPTPNPSFKRTVNGLRPSPAA